MVGARRAVPFQKNYLSGYTGISAAPPHWTQPGGVVAGHHLGY